MRRPVAVLLVIGLMGGFSLHYAARHLVIDTDTTEILDRELPFLQDRARLIEAFPQDDQAVLVVVDAPVPERVTPAVAYLADQFRNEKDQITAVYVPGEGDFFDRNGLLYLDPEDLRRVASHLVEAQPFIGALSHDNSLKTFLFILGHALGTKQRELPADLNPLLEEMRRAIDASLDGRHYSLSWQRLLFEHDQEWSTGQRFILLKPVLDFSALMPAEESLGRIRAIADGAKAAFPEVRIGLTGEVVLEHDELESVQRSARMASILSLLLVCTVLWIGLRSLKLVLITFAVLLLGLALTIGFATVAVGHLNLISISFAVLYIGIGVDYSIQLILRYRELLRQNLARDQALTEAIRKVAPSISLCAITTAVGFFSFIPTAYRGVSELGIIAGGGMFIALGITLTVLPALLSLFPLRPDAARPGGRRFPDWVYRFPIRHRIPIRWLAFLISVIGLLALTRAHFDFNPLNLRDPSAESVATFKELLASRQASPLTLTALAGNAEEATAMAEALKRLPTVESAVTLFDFVPEAQQEKFAELQSLSLVLALNLPAFPPPRQDTAANHTQALQKFAAVIEKRLDASPDDALAARLHPLGQALQRYLDRLQDRPEPEAAAMLDRLQRSLLETLPLSMDLLLRGLHPERVTVDTLPEDLAQRWVGRDGVHRVQIFPSQDLNDPVNLAEFIAEVRTVVPRVTDLPVIYLESGNAVVRAFQQALITALAGILLILLGFQHKLRDVALILIPLLMTAILTGAATVLLDVPFNFANIIVIPLLFGLGVDSGIYILHRMRAMPFAQDSVLRTSTARGVVFSGLTTLCSLVSMAFAPHPGLASMGFLLAVGLGLMLFCTLVVLPAFAARRA